MTTILHPRKQNQSKKTDVYARNRAFQVITSRFRFLPDFLFHTGVKLSLVPLIFLFLTGFGFLSPSWNKINKKIDDEFPNVNHITVEQLSVIMKTQEIDFIDVRTENEFSVSTLQGAINIEDPGNVTLQSDHIIVLFCSVGYRSARFTNVLQKKGFTRVYNLRGSLFEWANKGFPVFQGDTPTTFVHPYNGQWGKLLNKGLHYNPTD